MDEPALADGVSQMEVQKVRQSIIEVFYGQLCDALPLRPALQLVRLDLVGDEDSGFDWAHARSGGGMKRNRVQDIVVDDGVLFLEDTGCDGAMDEDRRSELDRLRLEPIEQRELREPFRRFMPRQVVAERRDPDLGFVQAVNRRQADGFLLDSKDMDAQAGRQSVHAAAELVDQGERREVSPQAPACARRGGGGGGDRSSGRPHLQR